MPDTPHSRLLSWLQRTIGEDLRVVARFDDADHEWVYRREDVAAAYTDQEFADTFENYRLIAPLVADQEDLLQAGDLRANVQLFDSVILIQYLHPSGAGTIISFDADLGLDLVEIVATGLQLLVGGETDAEGDLPEWAAE